MSIGVPSPARTPPEAPPGTPPEAPAQTPELTRPRERERDERRERPRSDSLARSGRWAPSPVLGRAELFWVAIAAVALAVITSWPLSLHLGSRIAPDLGDPVRTAWQIAWVGHALLNNPLHLFDSNAFY